MTDMDMPLPEPAHTQVETYSGIALNKVVETPLFTADQLRAYGEAVRAEERAAILDIAMRRSLLSDNLDQLRGYECCKEGIIASIKERAAAIRAAAPPQA